MSRLQFFLGYPKSRLCSSTKHTRPCNKSDSIVHALPPIIAFHSVQDPIHSKMAHILGFFSWLDHPRLQHHTQAMFNLHLVERVQRYLQPPIWCFKPFAACHGMGHGCRFFSTWPQCLLSTLLFASFPKASAQKYIRPSFRGMNIMW